jgi:phage gp16-like protein
MSLMEERRKGALAKIHIAKAWATKNKPGFDQDAYEAMILEASGGKFTSAGDCNVVQLEKVLAKFKELGWKAAPRKKKGAPPRPSRPITARDDWSRKIRALWIELDQCGALRDSSEAALASYVQRMTKTEENPAGVSALEWLRDPADFIRVVESLKKWLKREDKARTMIHQFELTRKPVLMDTPTARILQRLGYVVTVSDVAKAWVFRGEKAA